MFDAGANDPKQSVGFAPVPVRTMVVGLSIDVVDYSAPMSPF